jgi:hypothetical protein
MMGDGWNLYNFRCLFNTNKFGSDGQNWYSTPGVTGEYEITNIKLEMEEDPNMTQLPSIEDKILVRLLVLEGKVARLIEKLKEDEEPEEED